MKLSEEDADLFFKLMMPLLAFVNNKLGILPKISISEDLTKESFENIAKVRDALYENIHLIDSFIDENPEDIPLKDLAIVAKWKNFVEADFFIERYLKNYAVFISEDDKVFGVLSLRDSFDDMIPKFALPLRVKTVLLPFQDRIIYDGFLAHYNVHFGSGITEDLKRIYTKAKNRGNIVFSFDPNSPLNQTKKPAKSAKDWKPLIKELTEKAAKLRGGAGQEEILSPTFSLVKASLELANLVTENKTKREELYKCFEKIERNFNNIQQEFYYYK
ncbi:MAG: hypothetical protein ACR2L1_09165 [Pyrinomonadaceae bacterium]